MIRSLIALVAVSTMLAATGGNMAGTIVDPSGAVMPAVAVVARNGNTGVVYRAATNERGFYALPTCRSVAMY